MKLLIEKPEDIQTVIDGIIRDGIMILGSSNTMARDMNNYIGNVRERVLENGIDDIDWLRFYRNFSHAVLFILNNQFEFDSFASLLLSKHKLYGAQPLLDWRHIGILVRLNSKVSRYINMKQQDQTLEGTDESIFDTLRDMVGYCVLGIKLLEWEEEQDR